MTSRKARRSKWADDPLVPIDGPRLGETIAYWGRSRRELAEALSKSNRPVHAQTLDALCVGTQRRCRASLRRALAEELGVFDLWLARYANYPGLTLDNMLQNRRDLGDLGRKPWSVLLKWDRLVLDLGLPPNVYTAVLDLPGAIGQASLAMGLIERDATGGLHTDSSVARAGLEEFAAWHAWLQRWVEMAGRQTVRAALTRALPDLRTRFVQVNRSGRRAQPRRRAKTKR